MEKVVQRDYMVFSYDYFRDTPDIHNKPWETEPTFLPDWLINASLKYKRIVRVLGSTAVLIDPTDGTVLSEVLRGVKLMGYLTRNGVMKEFIGFTIQKYQILELVSLKPDWKILPTDSGTCSSVYRMRINAR
jgi:hypothetical protein